MSDLSEHIRDYVDGVDRPITMEDILGSLHGHRPLQRPLRLSLVFGVVGAAVAAVLFAIVLIPATETHPPTAAAAGLERIAAKVATQGSTQPGKNQWLLNEEQASIFASVTMLGSTPTPEAQATIGAMIRTWSNPIGDTCISATTSPAQFASPSNQEAWKAAGVLVSPSSQPVDDCFSGGGSPSANILGGGGGALDVSRLPTDPSVLERELRTGTTGLTDVDQLAPAKGENKGFERAVTLLVGPTAGETPAFRSALYSAMALIPRVHELGRMTTHTGAVGIGYAGSTTIGECTIIVDPLTGALLEAQNIQNSAVFTGLVPSYLAPPPAPTIGTVGGHYETTIRWFDPTSRPMIVGANSLPSDIRLPLHAGYTGTIVATSKGNLSYAQAQTISNQLQARFDGPGPAAYSGSSTLQATAGVPLPTSVSGKVLFKGAVLKWYFTGPKAQIGDYVTALNDSNEFSSVVAHYASKSR